MPLAVGLATFLAFAPVLGHDFVGWDDDLNFLSNPHYRGLGGDELRWMFTTFHMGHYIPVSWLTLGLDYTLWETDPRGYHLTNLLLHCANAVLLYFLSLRLFLLARPSDMGHGTWDMGRRHGFSTHDACRMSHVGLYAAFTALLFALHPLRAESVAWITQRRDVLSGFFSLLTVLLYLHEPGSRRRGLSLVCFTLAVLSRESCFMLAPVLLLIDFLLKLHRPSSLRISLMLIGLAGAGLAALATWRGTPVGIESTTRHTLSDRIAQAAHAIPFHLGKTLLPISLAPVYEMPGHLVRSKTILSGAISLVLLAGIPLLLRRRFPMLTGTWFTYLLLISPSLGFARMPSVTNDRFSYLACTGWAFASAAGFLTLAIRFPRLIRTGAALLVLSLGMLTRSQTGIWKDSLHLWRHTAIHHPRSTIAHNNLGTALAQGGKIDRALTHFRKALAILPHHPGALRNIEYTYRVLGQPERALPYTQRLRALQP
jgi:hypothetical protein